MPRQKKRCATATKEPSPDVFGFQNLHAQSKDVTGKYLEVISDDSWLQTFFQRVKTAIENAGKNFDLDELNAAVDVSRSSTQAASKENKHKKKKKKSSLTICRSPSPGILSATNTIQMDSAKDETDFHGEKEKQNKNIPLKTECDASENTICHTPVDNLNSKTLNVKLNNSVVALERSPIVDAAAVNETRVVRVSGQTSGAELDNVPETCETSSNAEPRSAVVLERLSDGRSKQYDSTVQLNDCLQTPALKVGRETEVIGDKILYDTKIGNCIVALDRLKTNQNTGGGECPQRRSSRISGKRKLSEENYEDPCLVSATASEASETCNQTFVMDVRIGSSTDSPVDTVNSVRVSKKQKISHPEESLGPSEDVTKNKISKTDDTSDSGRETASVGSSTGSVHGSQNNVSVCSTYAKQSLNNVKKAPLQSVKKNANTTFTWRPSQESMGYRTPEPNALRKDFSNSLLRLQTHKSVFSSQAKTTPRSTFVFSATKSAVSKSKAIGGSHSTKSSTPLHSGNTSLFRSQAAVLETEKIKYRQEEARRQQEREEALRKKKQLLQKKVEDQKRKREERMKKNLEARQQLEREKAERHKYIEEKERKVSAIAKEKELKKNKIKNDSMDSGGTVKKLYNPKAPEKGNAMINSTYVQVKEISSSEPVVSVVKHVVPETAPSSCDTEAQSLNTTFLKNEDGSPKSYDLTPCRPRSTYCNYDISDLKPEDEDSDDECSPKKPVPSWAHGIRFKQALIEQYHHPPNIDELFPCINLPDLNEMFAEKKPRYMRRTSSAVWNTPDRLIFALKS